MKDLDCRYAEDPYLEQIGDRNPSTALLFQQRTKVVQGCIDRNMQPCTFDCIWKGVLEVASLHMYLAIFRGHGRWDEGWDMRHNGHT